MEHAGSEVLRESAHKIFTTEENVMWKEYYYFLFSFLFVFLKKFIYNITLQFCTHLSLQSNEETSKRWWVAAAASSSSTERCYYDRRITAFASKTQHFTTKLRCRSTIPSLLPSLSFALSLSSSHPMPETVADFTRLSSFVAISDWVYVVRLLLLLPPSPMLKSVYCNVPFFRHGILNNIMATAMADAQLSCLSCLIDEWKCVHKYIGV